MKKVKFALIALVAVIITVINFNIGSKIIQDSSNSSLKASIISLTASAENQYPTGESCKELDCQVVCGPEWMQYTVQGKMWNCMYDTGSGTCNSSLCNKTCRPTCL